MNHPHAHLALHGTGVSAKGANSGSTRSLPPEGADASLGAARQEAS